MAAVRRLALNLGMGGGWFETSDSELVAANATTDADWTETLGRKADTAVNVIGTTASIMAYIKGLIAAVGSKVRKQTVSAASTAWTQAAHKLFTVTGTVKIKSIIGICDITLVGAGTLEVGIAGNTACLLAQIADAEDVDQHDIWAGRDTATHASKQAVGESEPDFIKDTDIDLVVGTANITAGQITFVIDWEPESDGATLVGATWD